MKMNRRTLIQSAGLAAVSTAVASEASAAPAAPAPAPAPFVPPTKEKPLLMCFNENPLGLSQAARDAVVAATADASRYPFALFEPMKAAIAKFIGGKSDNILLTHGSSEAIRASIEAYAAPGTRLIVPALTYSDGADVADRNGIPVIRVPMLDKWAIDIEGMKKAAADWYGPKIVYFVNPNNPTSSVADCGKLNAWIRSRPKNTLFILDEAYAEYVDDPSFVSGMTLVNEGFDNVIVLKTFSKLFAMAGMRLGYAYAVPAVRAQLRDHVAYDIMMNTCTLRAALAEIGDKDFIAYSRGQNVAAKKVLEDVCKELGLEYLPSQGNFMFINIKGDLKTFAGAMRNENILVGRPFPPALTWCRVSLGTPEETQYFAKKLREFRQKGLV